MVRVDVAGKLSIQVPNDLVSTYTNFEPLTTRVIQALLQPLDRFLDVGANLGYFSVLASGIVGPSGSVISIEASPEVVPMLKRNTARLTNVNIVETAVGDKIGYIDFFCTPDFVNSGVCESPFLVDKGTKISVPIDRLDNVLRHLHGSIEAVNCVKIDVQGDELAVLSGFKNHILHKSRMNLIVECAPAWMRAAGYDPSQMLPLLSQLGFNKFLIIDDYTQKLMTVNAMLDEFERDQTGKRFFNVLAGKGDVDWSAIDYIW